ncbi:INO80 complex subunit C [Apodemus speciosus]|uniref:INO80 complex subunit C n=1 Tax=Apodemus speciosus TaxID=105296 RepID=A0ABQ0FQH1_APOSI
MVLVRRRSYPPPALLRGVSMEAMSESKVASSELSSGPVEKAAKPLPFKDPSFVANYTDPQSKLRFSTVEEFSYIRRLPSDVVTGYLALRKATSIVP